MITPTYGPLHFHRGGNNDRTWTFTIGATPVNLTGYEFTLDVRDGKDDTAPLILRITSDVDLEYPEYEAPGYLIAEFVVTGSTGKLAMVFDQDVNDALPVGSYQHDLKSVSPDGTVEYWRYGPAVISRRITP